MPLAHENSAVKEERLFWWPLTQAWHATMVRLCGINEDMRQNSEAGQSICLVKTRLTCAIIAHSGGCVCLHTTLVLTTIFTFA
jgi:hypothetical protein